VDKWEVTGFVNNLSNRQVLESSFPNALAGADLIGAALRPPRTYGARFKVNF
jgi:outer membrane receptor protein involved in Fe transport